MRRTNAVVGVAGLAAVVMAGLVIDAGEARSQPRLKGLGPIVAVGPARQASPAPATPPAPAAAAPQLAMVQGRALARLAPATDAVNATFLQQLAVRQNKPCGQQEMAPGVWVRIDCGDYPPIAKAVSHYSARKLSMLKAGKLRVVPRAPNIRNLNLLTPRSPGGERAGAAPRDEAADKVRADGDIPEVTDFRATGNIGPVKNQGAVGSCTAFSLSSVLDSMLRKAGKSETVSPLHLWSHYGSPHMDRAFDTNLNRSITTYEGWPYSGRTACQLSREDDDDCGGAYDVKPNTATRDARIQREMTAAESSGKNKFISVERLDRSVDVDEVVQVLASGQPLWVAFRIESGKWRNSKIKNGVIPDWYAPDGGHAVALMGYRKLATGARQFLIQNSWSDAWADRGFAWVSDAMVKRYMYHAYKVKLDPSVLPKPAALTDEDCPPDQLADFTLNKCADFCADDDYPRPDNGQCGPPGVGSKTK